MLRSFGTSLPKLADLERVESWTRLRFSLPGDDIILVSENRCRLPGGPPLETEVAFWTDPQAPHRFKIFKAVADVDEVDIPVAWLRESLRDFGDGDCC